jgi:hypothetical protein
MSQHAGSCVAACPATAWIPGAPLLAFEPPAPHVLGSLRSPLVLIPHNHTEWGRAFLYVRIAIRKVVESGQATRCGPGRSGLPEVAPR